MDISGVVSALFTVALISAMPTGSSLLVALTSLQAGPKRGLMLALGVAATDGILAFATTIVGVGIVKSWPWVASAFALVASILLAVMAYKLYTAFRAGGLVVGPGQGTSGGLARVFLTGVTLTLADQKALIFYAVFFPTMVSNGSNPDLIAAAGIAAAVGLAIFFTKVLYVWLAKALVSRGVRKIGRAPVLIVSIGLFCLSAALLWSAGRSVIN